MCLCRLNISSKYNVQYNHFLSSSVQKFSVQFQSNPALAFCESMTKELLDDHINKITLVKVALNTLQQYLDTASKLEDPNNSIGLIQFLLEQLKLVAVNKNARTYSSDLITIAFLLKLTSTSLYTKYGTIGLQKLQRCCVSSASIEA